MLKICSGMYTTLDFPRLIWWMEIILFFINFSNAPISGGLFATLTAGATVQNCYRILGIKKKINLSILRLIFFEFEIAVLLLTNQIKEMNLLVISFIFRLFSIHPINIFHINVKWERINYSYNNTAYQIWVK